MHTAILVATAGGATPAAAQPWAGSTVLRRLVDQLESLGIHTVHVVARRPAAADLEASLDGSAVSIRMHPCDSPADDLRAIAGAARDAPSGVVVMYGDIVTQREALAGLLALPRIPTGILIAWWRRPFTQHIRANRSRIVSAGSPFHTVHKPTGSFHGVLKVAGPDCAALADAAERLAGNFDGPLPAEWQQELDRKPELWRSALERAEESEGHEAGHDEVDVGAEVDRRLAVVREDVVSPLLVGLVRSGTQVGAARLRQLFWARPLTPEELARAAGDIERHDEDRVLLNASVKQSDGFFTTFFVSTYSKYIARFAARIGLTPNVVTTISLLIGVAAAAAFATGDRAGLVAGGVLAYFAFVFDCVDGQLARYTRTFSRFGAWLDSVFDRAKEYAIFGGLAIGSAHAGDDVWVLAAAALTLQTARHAMDFSYGGVKQGVAAAVDHPPLEQSPDSARRTAQQRAAKRREARENGVEPAKAPPPRKSLLRRAIGRWGKLDGSPLALWLKKIVVFPIGERFAVIAIVSAIFNARATFTVLLACGGFAAVYATTGRFVRSLAR